MQVWPKFMCTVILLALLVFSWKCDPHAPFLVGHFSSVVETKSFTFGLQRWAAKIVLWSFLFSFSHLLDWKYCNYLRRVVFKRWKEKKPCWTLCLISTLSLFLTLRDNLCKIGGAEILVHRMIMDNCISLVSVCLYCLSSQHLTCCCWRLLSISNFACSDLLHLFILLFFVRYLDVLYFSFERWPYLHQPPNIH